jgi:hypothetical protein
MASVVIANDIVPQIQGRLVTLNTNIAKPGATFLEAKGLSRSPILLLVSGTSATRPKHYQLAPYYHVAEILSINITILYTLRRRYQEAASMAIPTS